MRTRNLLSFIALLLLSFCSRAQTQFWSDAFEDSGSPSVGARTASADFNCTANNAPNRGYFTRSNNAGLEGAVFTNIQGSKYWGACNLDIGSTCTALSSLVRQTITWSGIDITGKTGLSFKGLFGQKGTTTFQGLAFGVSQMDTMTIEYRINNGAWITLLAFYPNDGTAAGGKLAVDNNGDRIGDGTALGDALTEISANITGTGTTLDLRYGIIVNNNPTEGMVAIDNFRLFSTPSCNLTASVSNPTNVSCNGGTNGSATVTTSNAVGSLSYVWTPGTLTGNGTATISGLAPGVYTCVVTDAANSCTATATATITQPPALTATINSHTDVLCNGAATGAATVTAGGGTTSYTYLWAPSGGSAASATGLTAQAYTVTVTDAHNCTKTASVTIQQPTSAVTITPSQVNVSCNGGTNGSATATVSGGVTPYTYSWLPSGGSAATASNLTAGGYTVTVTDNNGCTKTQAYTIGQPTNALNGSISSHTDILCNGALTGAATVAPTGGTPGYTYSWAPSGGSAAAATGLGAATYTVTITDANNCTKTVITTISQPTNPVTILASKTDVSCNGGNNGTATASVTGGTPPYSYSWAPVGGSSAIASSLTAGGYTVTVTDANNCSKTQAYSIGQPTNALNGSITSHTDVLCNGASTGAATVTPTGGTPGYSYSWAPSGGSAASATSLTAATYTITITDANNCSKTVNTTISQPTNPVTIAPTHTDVSCNGGTNGTATATVTGGTPPYSYSWLPVGGSAATASSLTAGGYTVTVTDANNCSKTQAYTIGQPTNALNASVTSHTDVLCNGALTGAATITPTGGTGAYTYSWAPSGGSAATATGLAAATYTVTVSDANNCTKTINAIIQQPATPVTIVPSQTNASCTGIANGSATASVTGGTPPYSYSWAPNGGSAATAVALAAGGYTVTVTDANSCTKTQAYTIQQPASALSASISSQTDILCNGTATGAATVAPSGGTPPYTYQWSPNVGSAATATGLTAVTYTITVRDANLCVKAVNVTIGQSPAITITPSQNDVSCNGGNNGTATALVSGGIAPYSYAWTSNPSTGATATGLAQGGYTVTVTDGGSCTKTQSYTIGQPNALAANISSHSDVLCFGALTGSATVTATGGTSPYLYSWSPNGGSGATATGLAAQGYTVTVIDNHGCSKTASSTISQPATAIQVTASDDTNSCSGASVNLSATASGGTPTYSYVWNPGNISGASPTVNPTTTTSYVVTATDANSCTKTDTVLVSVGGALAQSNQNNSTSIVGSDTSSSNVIVGALTFLYNDDCKIIASVKNNVGLGSIQGNVNVIDSIPTIGNRPYLSRVYEITPQNNIPGNVNLYYTQEDFNNYNTYATAHSLPLLPQNPTDQVGIDSIVITKVSGTDFATGAHTLIHPDSVRWNSTLHFWTVSLQVPSFSYFLLHGSDGSEQPLAINLASFVVKKENNTAGIYWSTATEQNIAGFTVERSNDGKAFDAIGKVNSKAANGNSTTVLSYNFTDKTPINGWNFYRLAEADKTGNITYSDVRSINFNSASIFNCYPNPTSGIVLIEHNADNDAQYTVRFTDVLGKVVLETKMPVSKGFNKSSIDMSSLSQGLYNMSIIGNTSVIYNTRIVKK